jgi:hypothetical protein
MSNDVVAYNLNYDLTYNKLQELVYVDYIDYIKTDYVHPSLLRYELLWNAFREDEEKILIVEMEEYD